MLVLLFAGSIAGAQTSQLSLRGGAMEQQGAWRGMGMPQGGTASPPPPPVVMGLSTT